jgi:flagellar basal body P-ring protein FlgI
VNIGFGQTIAPALDGRSVRLSLPSDYRQRPKAQEQKSNLGKLGKNATVEDLIRALNALGVTPRDTIAILEALKSAGALQAELEVI